MAILRLRRTRARALLVLDADGGLRSCALLGSTAASHLRATAQGHLVLFSGAALIEATAQGEVLRRRSFGDLKDLWYYGGLCVSDSGAIGITGRVGAETHFDFLDEPLPLQEGATFVLHLADWEAQVE